MLINNNAFQSDISPKEKIFTGPIKDQSGQVRIKAGEVASDGTLLGITWFVEGVIGTTQ